MRGTLVLSLIISVLMVVFALLNNEDVIVNLGFVQTEGPIALILLVTFIVGVIAGILASLPSRWKTRKRVRELEERLAEEHRLMEEQQASAFPHTDPALHTTHEPPPPPPDEPDLRT